MAIDSKCLLLNKDLIQRYRSFQRPQLYNQNSDLQSFDLTNDASSSEFMDISMAKSHGEQVLDHTLIQLMPEFCLFEFDPINLDSFSQFNSCSNSSFNYFNSSLNLCASDIALPDSL